VQEAGVDGHAAFVIISLEDGLQRRLLLAKLLFASAIRL
jgi:hypothetical protein